MNTHVTASANTIRAISATAAGDVVQPIRLTVFVILAVLYGLTCYLALSFSALWWLLLIILLPITLIAIAISIVISIGIRKLQPRRYNRSEKKALRQFTHTVLGAAASINTTPQRLAISVVKNSLMGKPSAILGDIMQNSSGVIEEFKAVRTIIEK